MPIALTHNDATHCADSQRSRARRLASAPNKASESWAARGSKPPKLAAPATNGSLRAAPSAPRPRRGPFYEQNGIARQARCFSAEPKKEAPAEKTSWGGLADQDRIFTNLYGERDWRLVDALKRAIGTEQRTSCGWGPTGLCKR